MEWIYELSEDELGINAEKSANTATAVGHRVYVMGGDTPGMDSYQITPERVWKLLPASERVCREDHTTHLVDDRLIIIGGQIIDSGRFETPGADVFEFSLIEDKLGFVEASGDAPSRVRRHVSEYFDWRREVIMFGGKRVEDGVFTDELTALNVDTMRWNKLYAKGEKPPPQSSHMSCASRDKMYIFVSYDDPVLSNLFVLDVQRASPSWSIVKQRGSVPPGIFAGSLVLVDRYIVMFGGALASSYVQSLYICDLERETWYKARDSSGEEAQYTFTVQGPEPPLMGRHTGIYDSERIRYYDGLLEWLDTTLELVVDRALIRETLQQN